MRPMANAAQALMIGSTLLALTVPALAQGSAQVPPKDKKDSVNLEQLQSELEAYRHQMAAQQALVAKQEASLKKLQAALRQQTTRILALEKQTHAAMQTQASPKPASQPKPAPVVTQTASAEPQPQAQSAAPAPQQETKPVGQAPGQAPRPQVQALSDLGGVLTPRGTLSLEPSLEFDHVSTNQLIFRGISIVQGLLVGVIDASDIRGDTTIAALTARYGLTNRLELEAKVPYLYRQNSETDIPATSNAHPFQSYTTGHGIGDVELAAHYQFNSGADSWPIFVGNLRYKTDTGTGPFDVAFDQSNGAPLALPTGSGFTALEPSLTFIFPTDPVVLFGSVEYDHSFGKNENRTISQTCGPQNNQACVVGEVTPGDSFGATLGMAIALNESTSLTLGYQHYYIGGTTVMLNNTPSKSTALQVGSLLVGGSYQVNSHVGVNFTTQIGATRDAPDVRVMLRIPIAIDLFGG
ncbi:MAG: transporter [Alphaproteobacteria bacterium]|nr:transporter [Alphaproteobacteria bacterium]